jgi:hypothetical protein
LFLPLARLLLLLLLSPGLSSRYYHLFLGYCTFECLGLVFVILAVVFLGLDLKSVVLLLLLLAFFLLSPPLLLFLAVNDMWRRVGVVSVDPGVHLSKNAVLWLQALWEVLALDEGRVVELGDPFEPGLPALVRVDDRILPLF